MSEEHPNKKQRIVDSVVAAENDSAVAVAVAEESFHQLLGCNQIPMEDIPEGNYADALIQVKKDTKTLENIQALLSTLLIKQEEKRRKVHQKFSRLSWLDRPIQKLLLEFVDEEALWVLEESAVLDLGDSEEQEALWKSRTM